MFLILFLISINGVFGIEWNYDTQHSLSWASDCDFEGGDLTSAQIQGESCGPTCTVTPGCTHFTWSSYNDGTCWMKSGSVSKTSAIYKKDSFYYYICGILDSKEPNNIVLYNVLATRHGATEMGACELPDNDYAVNLPVALGDIYSLDYLKFDPKYCGHVLQIDCGNGKLDIIVTNSNLGGGLDLYGSTWDLATNRKPPGETKCSVQLSNRNIFKTTGYVCYHATDEVNNQYYRNVGLFNTNDKMVVGATFKGIKGSHRGSNGYWAFDGYGTGDDQVTFYFNDDISHIVYLRDCKNGSNKKIWS